VITDKELLSLLADKIGPWLVTGSSRFIAIQTLKDKRWQSETRNTLKLEGQRLETLFEEQGFIVEDGSALFQWFKHLKASELFELLAKQGILVCLFDNKTTTITSLRFGLPKTEQQWQHSKKALNSTPDSLKAVTDNKDIITHV